MDVIFDAAERRDREWCRFLWANLAEGGMWGVPRSGLVFSKREGELRLVQRMPWTDELAAAAAAGQDVPGSAAELRAFQDADAETIRRKFAEAEITVRTTIEGEEE